jgi:hypothetical protein
MSTVKDDGNKNCFKKTVVADTVVIASAIKKDLLISLFTFIIL